MKVLCLCFQPLQELQSSSPTDQWTLFPVPSVAVVRLYFAIRNVKKLQLTKLISSQILSSQGKVQPFLQMHMPPRKMPPFLPIFVKVIELHCKGWVFLARGPQTSSYLADGTHHSSCA